VNTKIMIGCIGCIVTGLLTFSAAAGLEQKSQCRDFCTNGTYGWYRCNAAAPNSQQCGTNFQSCMSNCMSGNAARYNQQQQQQQAIQQGIQMFFNAL